VSTKWHSDSAQLHHDILAASQFGDTTSPDLGNFVVSPDVRTDAKRHAGVIENYRYIGERSSKINQFI
jgi:hypothetical protein